MVAAAMAAFDTIMASHPLANCIGNAVPIGVRSRRRWTIVAIAVAGLKENRPFIMVHKSMRPIAADYFARILSAYDT